MSRILFIHDTYYAQDGDKTYAYGAFPYTLWQNRFLKHFDHITIIGRKHTGPINKAEQSSGPNVNFLLLENINTPLRRIFESKRVKQQIKSAINNADAIILRGPSEFGMIAAKIAKAQNKPIAIELSGCAFDHSFYHSSPIAKLYAPIKYLRARALTNRADQILYVTNQFLQSRYPFSGHTTHASNVEIPEPNKQTLKNRLTRINKPKDKIILGIIGNYNNKLKGLHILLKSLNQIKNDLPPFELRILGHGDPQKINTHGLTNQIKFDPPVSGGKQVHDWLDQIDIYLQPSFHEGLPRALIEAMSRGAPALASDAGGTPELLPVDCIHKRGNHKQFADHIRKALDQNWQTTQATQNFETAKQYSEPFLTQKRTTFYNRFADLINERKSHG